jgi:hypothetical protein
LTCLTVYDSGILGNAEQATHDLPIQRSGSASYCKWVL